MITARFVTAIVLSTAVLLFSIALQFGILALGTSSLAVVLTLGIVMPILLFVLFVVIFTRIETKIGFEFSRKSQPEEKVIIIALAVGLLTTITSCTCSGTLASHWISLRKDPARLAFSNSNGEIPPDAFSDSLHKFSFSFENGIVDPDELGESSELVDRHQRWTCVAPVISINSSTATTKVQFWAGCVLSTTEDKSCREVMTSENCLKKWSVPQPTEGWKAPGPSHFDRAIEASCSNYSLVSDDNAQVLVWSSIQEEYDRCSYILLAIMVPTNVVYVAVAIAGLIWAYNTRRRSHYSSIQ